MVLDRILGCTIIMVSGSGVVLAGSNEDSAFPLTMVWYTPASERTYARINLEYKMMLNSVQRGMNEKGLFVDGNALEFPDSARSHFELANVFLAVDNKDKAIAEYKKTLIIDPGNKQASRALESLKEL